MKKTAVLIATTEGPSEVQCITAEDPDVNSVFCLDRKAIPLEISSDYDAFVRRPTGVIDACFGHGAYRIDVSHPITCGLSWQLGAFIAHALADAGKLAGPGQKASQAVWASGEVDRALRVGRVDDIARKLKQSQTAFAAWSKKDAEIVVVVPTANVEDARIALQETAVADPDRIRLLAVDTVDDILVSLHLARHRQRESRPARPRSTRSAVRSTWRSAAVGVCLAALTVAAIAIWSWKNGDLNPLVLSAEAVVDKIIGDSDPPVAGIDASMIETRPPTGGTCAAVYFGLTSALVNEQAVSGTGNVPNMTARGLCDLHYRITNRLKTGQTLWVLATRDNLEGGRFRTRIFQQAQQLPAGESLDLDGRPPRHLKNALIQEFIILATPSDNIDEDGSVATALHHLANVKSRSDFARNMGNIGKTGAAVYRIEQIFRP